MSREKGRMVRCANEADGVRCHRRAELVGFDHFGGEVFAESYTCEGCREGNKPYVPRVGRPGQQKQAR